jgi:hypothetical protein
MKIPGNAGLFNLLGQQRDGWWQRQGQRIDEVGD